VRSAVACRTVPCNVVSDGGGDGQQVVRSDPPRLLPLRSELGYTDRLDRAMRDEPEAVPADVQEQQSTKARRDWIERRRQAWIETRAVVVPALDAFADVVANDRGMLREVRALRRGLDRVGQRV
jgi:hypothetical protein